ncbi:unnamed protein product [Rhizoctonia solani]|uniref:Transmembrane protein n=1 Tax=Rhizoctonia solani TaxID=456999 RepID=A0A8H2XIB8_9AGAM|nr:unnamed protein product [Rhizoctonia solani]
MLQNTRSPLRVAIFRVRLKNQNCGGLWWSDFHTLIQHATVFYDLHDCFSSAGPFRLLIRRPLFYKSNATRQPAVPVYLSASSMDATLPSEPSAAMLNLSALAYLLGTTIITWCMARVSKKYRLWTKKGWKTMTWARICFLLVLLNSWLYILMTGALLYGASRHHSPHRCSLGIHLCVLLYTTEKVLIHLCLTERVRAVWGASHQRWQSSIYIFCISLVLPLLCVVGIVIIPRVVHYIHNGYCVLGFDRLSSVLLPAYDISINVALSDRASLISLVTTVTNCAVIYILNGNEAIWVCFGSCVVDLVTNAAGLYWALQGPDESTCSWDRSVHTSSIGNIASPQPGAAHAVAVNRDLSEMLDEPSQQDDPFEDGSGVTTYELALYVSDLQRPDPIVQRSRHDDNFLHRSPVC